MKPALGLFAVFLLAGCLPQANKQKQVADCRDEADRFYQGYNNFDVENPRGKYIVSCMAAKGYKFQVSREDCDSRHPLVTQPACYAPRGWIARVLDGLPFR